MSAFNLWLTKIALHHRQLAINQQSALTGLWPSVNSVNYRLENKENGRRKQILTVYEFQSDWSATKPVSSSFSYLSFHWKTFKLSPLLMM